MTLLTTKTGTDLIFTLPYVCPRCGHFGYWFVNAGGRTRCIQCKDKTHEELYDGEEK